MKINYLSFPFPDEYYGLLLQLLMAKNQKRRKDITTAMLKGTLPSKLSCSTATLDRILSGNALLKESDFYKIIDFLNISLDKSMCYYAKMVFCYRGEILKKQRSSLQKYNRTMFLNERLDFLNKFESSNSNNPDCMIELANVTYDEVCLLHSYENKFLKRIYPLSYQGRFLLYNCAKIANSISIYDQLFFMYYLVSAD